MFAGNRCLHAAIVSRRASVGAMVDPTVRHLPHRSGDLLFSSRAGAEHGGIPIVAPWFADTLGPQMHGWARDMDWRRVSDSECALDHDGFALRFASTVAADAFEFTLACTNAGPAPRTIQLALHPYWAVDATAARVTGLDGAEYFDKTDGKTKRFAGELEFGGERDWVFASVAKLKLIDARRSLTFSLTGTDHVVVWNPGPKACREAPALGDEEWREFACVEPALLGRDLAGLALEPGQTAAIGMRVEVAAR